MSFTQQRPTYSTVSSTQPADPFYMIQALHSEHFQAVEQRIIRQLMQAIIYEDILPYTQTAYAYDTAINQQSPHLFTIAGSEYRSASGAIYMCR
ncbi:siderophore synthetase component [Paenibacillus sp. SORGH_AS306]|uniref:hypothetical protein n=1 Tax=Paenibacillus sp. SORGH_AS_0306 TaxID=3041754 RepID=UPI00278595D2|nr:hypothetical protein [Paenibacillus sp. SORGH_AS_0306]MDQ1234074.1 siderophore synthetase component [Paenibacillus sp. SORGH_AS_0306]